MRKLRLFNSDGRQLQDFIPMEDGKAGLYSCGPTVYNYPHIGNLRAYTQWDILRRVLERFDYKVTHVMNITDVGHLTDDGDEGEDKMIQGARKRGMSVWDIADFFTKAFFEDIDSLNILRPTVSCKATEHIPEMIQLVRVLEERGFAYTAGGNIYFDTGKFPDYGRLALLDKKGLRHGDRIAVDENKKSPLDFVLWFTKGKFENQVMLWNSPWGKGYPGWHLECSAMSSKYLGETFDIHTGGVDHIPVHHTNEIAQCEAAIGRKWVNFWLHNEFLIMNSEKMAKSKDGFLTLKVLTEDGYDPLDYRYFLLSGHYRSQLKFSADAMDGARASRRSLMNRLIELRREAAHPPSENLHRTASGRLEAFDAALADDLMTPRALAELWGLLKDKNIPPGHRLAGALNMDAVLGLSLNSVFEATGEQPDKEVLALLGERNTARKARDWKRADILRDRLAGLGWAVEDDAGTSKLKKIHE